MEPPLPSPQGVPPSEVEVDAGVVRRLLAEQHPDLAHLPLRPVGWGWDNVIFRLGDEMCVRLPRREVGARTVLVEQRWLPIVGPRLPVATPIPLRTGEPGPGFPWPWSICRWFEGVVLGESAPAEGLVDDLVAVVEALHRPAPPDAPHNVHRGVPLASIAERFTSRLAQVGGLVDQRRLASVWDDALEAPAWDGPPTWIHGDLHPLNLVVRAGRLTALLDFGDLCAGDPATDLAVAWTAVPRRRRDGFCTSLGLDAATWLRARGWALHLGVAFLAHSVDAPRHRRVGDQIVAAVSEG